MGLAVIPGNGPAKGSAAYTSVMLTYELGPATSLLLMQGDLTTVATDAISIRACVDAGARLSGIRFVLFGTDTYEAWRRAADSLLT